MLKAFLCSLYLLSSLISFAVEPTGTTENSPLTIPSASTTKTGTNDLATTATNDSRVKVQILWDYKEIPDGMKIYEIKGKQILWKTEATSDLAKLPFEKEIADSTLILKPGQTKKFALGYKNNTDKPLYFFAAPHSAEPPENSLGFKFKCLCINHAYHLKPGETWYRIVEFKLSKAFTDKQLGVKHILIGINQGKAEKINSAPPVDAAGHHDM